MPSPNGFHFHLLLLNFHEMWQFFEINLGIFYQIWNLLLDPVPIIGKNQRFSQIFGQIRLKWNTDRTQVLYMTLTWSLNQIHIMQRKRLTFKVSNNEVVMSYSDVIIEFLVSATKGVVSGILHCSPNFVLRNPCL